MQISTTINSPPYHEAPTVPTQKKLPPNPKYNKTRPPRIITTSRGGQPNPHLIGTNEYLLALHNYMLRSRTCPPPTTIGGQYFIAASALQSHENESNSFVNADGLSLEYRYLSYGLEKHLCIKSFKNDLGSLA